jgi:hypothetical protein
MNKTGLVMKTEKNSASIMTCYGEFFKVKITSKKPQVGEEYTGKLKKDNSLIRNFITAASLLFMILSGSGVYAYYTPTSSIVININPSIELKANRWDRIIKYSALNKDGETILKSISIRNKPLNQGLNIIVEQSKKDNFIDENYVKDGKIIRLQVSVKGNKSLDLSKFQKNTIKNNLNLDINDNGEETHFKIGNDKVNLKDKNMESKTKADLNPNKTNQNTTTKKPKDLEIKDKQNNNSREKEEVKQGQLQKDKANGKNASENKLIKGK